MSDYMKFCNLIRDELKGKSPIEISVECNRRWMSLGNTLGRREWNAFVKVHVESVKAKLESEGHHGRGDVMRELSRMWNLMKKK